MESYLITELMKYSGLPYYNLFPEKCMNFYLDKIASTINASFYTNETYIILISVFSIWGYIDLRLDLQRFDRASNGKRQENTNLQSDIDASQVASFYEIDFISSKYEDLNCFEASKNLVLSKYIHHSSIGSFGTGINNEIESEAVRCHLAKSMIFAINDKLMLLVVLAACSINMIFQSVLAVCNGKHINIDILFCSMIYFMHLKRMMMFSYYSKYALGKRSAAYVTNLSFLLSKTHLDASTGVRRKVLIELSFLAIFAFSMLVAFFIPANGKEGNLFQVSSKSLAQNIFHFYSKLDCINVLMKPFPFLESCTRNFHSHTETNYSEIRLLQR